MNAATTICGLGLLLAQTSQQAPAQTGNDMLVLWGVLLVCAAFLLFFVEVFVPSGGLIAAAGAVCLAAGIVMLFRVDTTLGLAGALVTIAALPFLVGFALKVWPDLPLARLMVLRGGSSSDDASEPVETADASSQQAQAVSAGMTGQAVSDLRPVGMCVIEGHRIECLATTGVIETGQPVRVVSADGMQVKVAAG